MTIALARDVEAFWEEQVKSGACQNPSDLVNDALRSIREQQHKSFEVTPELEAWLLEASDKPLTPLTREDFDRIRKKLRPPSAFCGVVLKITTTRRVDTTKRQRTGAVQNLRS